MESELFRKKLRKTLQYCLIMNGGTILLNWYTVSPIGWGGSILLPLVMGLILFITFGAILILPIAVCFLPWKRYRVRATYWVLISLCYGGIGIGALMASQTIRRHGFMQLAERSRPFVQAIHTFEAQYGAPPATLDDLIPDMLPAIPPTRMPAYPQYRYETASDHNDLYGNTWTVYIPILSGLMSFDRFFYFPLQNYPPSAYSAWIERVGDWAYAHE